MTAPRLEEEKAELLRALEETRTQMEEDADREIEELKQKFEDKFKAERDKKNRLKGDNGIMRKKFGALLKDIAEQKEEMKTMVRCRPLPFSAPALRSSHRCVCPSGWPLLLLSRSKRKPSSTESTSNCCKSRWRSTRRRSRLATRSSATRRTSYTSSRSAIKVSGPAPLLPLFCPPIQMCC